MSSIVRLIRKAIKANKRDNNKRLEYLLKRIFQLNMKDRRAFNDFFNEWGNRERDEILVRYLVDNFMSRWRVYRRDKRKHHRTMFMDFYDDSKQVVFKYNKTWHYPKKTIFWDILSTADGMLYNQPIDPPEA